MRLYWDNLEAIQKLKEVLDKDQIALTSSDTVLGLLGRLTQQSYYKLNSIKHRSEKPYVILMQSVKHLPQFIDQKLNKHLQTFISKVWPGPVTLIFKAKSDLPSYIKNNNGTIALRVPNHPGLLRLLCFYEGLFSTSANIHTAPIPQTIDEIDPQLLSNISVECYQREYMNYPLIPSTILDCSSEKIKVVRSGCCLRDELKNMIDSFL